MQRVGPEQMLIMLATLLRAYVYIEDNYIMPLAKAFCATVRATHTHSVVENANPISVRIV